MTDQDARLATAFEQHQLRLFRGIDRCRSIVADCRSKLIARVHHAGKPEDHAQKPPPLQQS